MGIRNDKDRIMNIAETGGYAAANGLIGMGLTQFNNKNQLKQQEKLIEQQMEAQKEMSQYNQGLAMQMWEDTNYNAQRKQMEKAGLNVGLMYGMGGGGGTTANSQPSSGIGGAQASPQMMGLNLLQVGQQMKLSEAQKENIEADTSKKEIEANKLAGIDTDEGKQRILQSLKGMELTNEEIKLVAQQTGKTEQEIKNLMKGIEVLDKGIEKTEEEIKLLGKQIGLTDQQINNLIEQEKLTKAQTSNTQKDTELKGAEIKLTEAQTKQVKQATQKIIADIINGQIQLNQKDIELNQGEWKIKNEATRIKIETILKKEGLNIENKKILNDALKTIIIGAGVISNLPNARPVIGY